MNVVILCARQSSTRLPGKALVDVCGKPILQHIIERYQTSRRIDKIIVATPVKDNDIADLCERIGVDWYGGSLDNVVCRMNNALECYAPEADYVFRGLGDMPLFDVDLLDWRFDLLQRYDADVCWIGTHDDPLPVYGSRESPWSRAAWDRIAAESAGDECEHAGQFLYSRMREFKVIHTDTLPNEYYQPFRLELDTEEDLLMLRCLYGLLYVPDMPETPRTLTALRYLKDVPEVAAINADVEEKTLTKWNFKERGIAWACSECGATQMHTGVIRHGNLRTHCDRCGAIRVFKQIPQFLADRDERRRK